MAGTRLSLGDRACLVREVAVLGLAVLGLARALPVHTADRVWADLGLPPTSA